MRSRTDICRATAAALRDRRPEVAQLSAFVGFDGFIDEICAVVETRGAAGDFQPVGTISRFTEKLASAAGRSGNYELVVREARAGGNGPILAAALAGLGLGVTCVGAMGFPQLDPLFAELGRRVELRTIAPAAHTDALEFSDGKLMLGKMQALAEITWENLLRRLGGVDELKSILSRARLISMVNWTMIAQMSRIWAKLIADVLPELEGPRRMILIDLADPEKRTRDDLVYALRLLGKMQELADVTLGLNLKEAQQVCGALGLSALGENPPSSADAAERVRQALQIDCCVIHPRTGAAASDSGGAAAWLEGPFVREPAISTGAGDHFNAGFMLGRLLGLPLEESLCTGVATSGWYVRKRRSPGITELNQFIEELPAPEH